DEDREAGDRDAKGGEEAQREGKRQSEDDADKASGEGDEEGFREELELDLAVGGANGFADADLANARGDRCQHDVHDADAANDQGNGGNQEQDSGERVGGFGSHVEQLAEVLHVVDRLSAMARLEHGMDLVGGAGDISGIGHGEEQLLDVVGPGEEARDGIGDEHGVVGNLGLAEGFDALAEHANDGERKPAEADVAANGIVGAPKLVVGKRFRYKSDFIARVGVVVVEEASGEHQQVADLRVFGRDAEDHDVALLASGNADAVMQFDERRGGANAVHFLAHGMQILEGELVLVDLHAIGSGAGLIFGVDHVGADRLNLPEDVLLAGETDGDNEDERRGTDDHAERGQHETYSVSAEGFVGELGDLAEDELRFAAVRRDGTSWGKDSH